MSEAGLRLTLDQAQTLLVAVQVCLRLDAAVISHVDVQQLATQQIRDRQGEAAVAHLDQQLAQARDRLPKLTALLSLLQEHLDALEGGSQ